jgi:WD40 repeat protein
VYSTQTGEVVAQLEGVWAERTDGYVNNDYNYLSLAVSRDGRWTAIGAPRQPVRILNVDTNRQERPLGSPGLHVYAFSPNGESLVTGTDYPQRIEIWDVRSGRKLHEALSSTHQGAARFSPDGKRLAIWGLRGAEFWEPNGKRSPVKFSAMARSARVDQNERVYSIVFDQGGGRALIVGEYHTHIWDFETQRLLATIEQYLLANAIVLPDRAHFLAGVGGVSETAAFLGIWRLADGELVARIPTEGDVGSIGLSEDGALAATGTERSVAEVWDLGWIRLSDDAQALQQHVCEKRFIGAGAYTPQQLSDPILRGRQTIAAPCERHGPLSLAYWRQLVSPPDRQSARQVR